MVTRKCVLCGKDTVNPKFCSKSCAASFNNRKAPKRKISKKCRHCDNTVYYSRTTLCEHHYRIELSSKKEQLQSRTLKEYTERLSLRNLHSSSRFVHIRGLCRSWNKDKLKLPCHVCGYDKHVELAHIKALSTYPLTATLGEVNSPENVIQLCPNCHWEFDNGLITLAFPDQPGSQ